MMKIEYITSNPGKFEEARYILSDWELVRHDIELTEIQGLPEEIIVAKAKEALEKIQKPLVVEDVSVSCSALNGLPGPYIKEFLMRLGDAGLAQLIHKYEDHSAQVICNVAYITPSMEPVIFRGMIEGTIVSPKGDLKHGIQSWNTIFLPAGSSKTFGELSMEEHSKKSMRFIALSKLKKYLQNQS
jgi:inosine triphosphate pyrophosphatase